jgi:hypothetical protein
MIYVLTEGCCGHAIAGAAAAVVQVMLHTSAPFQAGDLQAQQEELSKKLEAKKADQTRHVDNDNAKLKPGQQGQDETQGRGNVCWV